MRHKINTIVFAQGWLGNELEQAAAGQLTDEGKAVAEQVLAQFKILDEGIDDLIKENVELKSKLANVAASL